MLLSESAFVDNNNEELDWFSWNKEAWESWLFEVLTNREKVYSGDPDEMEAGYNREKRYKRDYHGRELLELIQNADDAGTNFGKPNKLLLRLTNHALFIANTGIPFSPSGFKSLIISDKSPKSYSRTKFIGHMGLGFRSILGWASSIIILSGKITFGFSEEFARGWLEDLRKRNKRIDNFLKSVKNGSYPIAALSVPYLFNPNSVKNELYNQCEFLKNCGYDTVICLPFIKLGVMEQIQAQIESLKKELILFLQNIDSIIIESTEKTETWRIEKKGNQTTLYVDNAPKKWKIFGKCGELPSTLAGYDCENLSNFETKIAVPEAHNVNISSGKLFSYFPTEILFPFPVIAHATFDLAANRQHLNYNEGNRFIAEELASLMVCSAETYKNYNHPWQGLLMVTPQKDSLDPTLEQLGFLDTLIQETKLAQLIPVRNGRFMNAVESRTIKGDFDTILTTGVFENLVLFSNDKRINECLENLGVKDIDYNTLKEELNRISSSITLSDRVTLIYKLVKNRLIDGEPPNLLLDTEGEIILSERTVLFPPEGKSLSLPAWVPIKMVKQEMALSLKDIFKISRIRDLVQTLSSFKVQEYNFTNLVSSIIAETNRLVRKNEKAELVIRQEMIRTLWDLYRKTDDRTNIDRNVIIPSRGLKFRPANELYLGKEYKKGLLTENLLINVNPDDFVGSPDILGIKDVSDIFDDFLVWLGVSNSPQILREEFLSNSAYYKYVVSCQVCPATFNDAPPIKEKRELTWLQGKLANVSTINQLEDILSKADPIAVLCWLATNPELDQWRIKGDNSTLQIVPSGKQNLRTVLNKIPTSHPLWLIRTTKWLPISGGKKQSPQKCFFADGARDLSEILGYPDIDYNHPLFKELSIDRITLKATLEKIGVATAIDDLSWESIYEILFDYPKKDSKGQKAKSLYRKILSKQDTNLLSNFQGYQKFVTNENGKMLGRLHNKVDYFTINKLFYVEDNNFPEYVLAHYPLLEMDKRRSATQIKKIFGIEPLTKDKVQIHVEVFELHPLLENLSAEVEKLKPYIYSLRIDEDSTESNLRDLKKLKIRLCKSGAASFLVEGERRRVSLKNGDFINIQEEIFLVMDGCYNSVSLLTNTLVADAFGVIITSIFDVNMVDSVSRLATCPMEDRDILLERLSGGSGLERLKKAQQALNQIDEDIISDKDLFTPIPNEPTRDIGNISEREQEIEDEEDESDDEDNVPNDHPSVGSVVVTAGGPITPSSKRKISRRIQLNSRPKPGKHKKKINPDKAEDLALRFEEEQGRVPKKISFFRGSDAYGCDFLSFKDEHDLAKFETDGNEELVERFIEVKGSSSRKGAVVLKGYELRSAEKYKEKYFIYRVFFDKDENLYELVETKNPLHIESDAIESQYEVHPFRSKKVKLWEVKEIESEIEYS